MYVVAIAWIYVILMMSITEETIVAGVMTFLLYGVLPLVIILYLGGTSKRKRRRALAEAEARGLHTDDPATFIAETAQDNENDGNPVQHTPLLSQLDEDKKNTPL